MFRLYNVGAYATHSMRAMFLSEKKTRIITTSNR